MDEFRNLDTVSDREFTVPTGPQESKIPRCPWHKPVLRRSEVTLYTRQGSPHVSFDLTAATGFGVPLS